MDEVLPEGSKDVGDDVWNDCSSSSYTEENVEQVRTMVLANRCIEVLKHLHEHIPQVRPILWKNKFWILHHNNAPAHSSILVCEFV